MTKFPIKLYRLPSDGKFNPKVHYQIAKNEVEELFWRNQKYIDLESAMRRVQLYNDLSYSKNKIEQYSFWVFFAFVFLLLLTSWATAKYLGYL